MKKILSFLLFPLLFSLQACAQEQWKEGEHYVIVADEVTEKPEVLEFFSYWCPHCYQFEPLAAQIKQKLDKDVSFTKVQVNFMGFTGPDVQDDATRALMVARSLDKEEQLSAAIFKYIHVNHSIITGLRDLKNLFIVNGVEADEFDKLAKSFAVNSMFNKNNKNIEKYRKYLNGVPNFIINGKYQAKFTRDMTENDMINLIVWLSKQK
jgi:protein dithiol oxidoreductase (disulfide-forming)